MQQSSTATSAVRISSDRSEFSRNGLGALQQQDPLGFVAGDANLHRYVGNDPTNATDPSGLRESDLKGILASLSRYYQPIPGPLNTPGQRAMKLFRLIVDKGTFKAGEQLFADIIKTTIAPAQVLKDLGTDAALETAGDELKKLLGKNLEVGTYTYTNEEGGKTVSHITIFYNNDNHKFVIDFRGEISKTRIVEGGVEYLTAKHPLEFYRFEAVGVWDPDKKSTKLSSERWKDLMKTNKWIPGPMPVE